MSENREHANVILNNSNIYFKISGERVIDYDFTFLTSVSV